MKLVSNKLVFVQPILAGCVPFCVCLGELGRVWVVFCGCGWVGGGGDCKGVFASLQSMKIARASILIAHCASALAHASSRRALPCSADWIICSDFSSFFFILVVAQLRNKKCCLQHIALVLYAYLLRSASYKIQM